MCSRTAPRWNSRTAVVPPRPRARRRSAERDGPGPAGGDAAGGKGGPGDKAQHRPGHGRRQGPGEVQPADRGLERTLWWLVCDSAVSGPGPSGAKCRSPGGMYASGASPVATTTATAAISSPSSNSTVKPDPARSTDTTRAGSISPTNRSANHIPYPTKTSHGIGVSSVSSDSPCSRRKSASRPPGTGADRSVAAGVDFKNMPVAIACRQLPITSPKTPHPGPGGPQMRGHRQPVRPGPGHHHQTARPARHPCPGSVLPWKRLRHCIPRSSARTPQGTPHIRDGTPATRATNAEKSPAPVCRACLYRHAISAKPAPTGHGSRRDGPGLRTRLPERPSGLAQVAVPSARTPAGRRPRHSVRRR